MKKSPEAWLPVLISLARQSLCRRAQCGSIIVKDGEIIGRGYNAPPLDDPTHSRCRRKAELKAGFKSDRTCCVHAEQRAIMEALRRNPDKLTGSRLYFIRLDEKGALEPAGKPYCTHCSKLALDSGIAEFVLWHRAGPRIYLTNQYNDLSYQYNGDDT